MPHSAMAGPCCARGKVSSVIACDSGTSGAPNRPWQLRHRISSGNEVARPHKSVLMVKPSTAPSSRRLRPSRAASQPGRRRRDRRGDDVEGQHPGDLIDARRQIALHLRQGDVRDGQRGRIERGRQNDREEDERPSEAGVRRCCRERGQSSPRTAATARLKNLASSGSRSVSIDTVTVMPARSAG